MAEVDDEMIRVSDMAQVFEQVYNTVVNFRGLTVIVVVVFVEVLFFFTPSAAN